MEIDRVLERPASSAGARWVATVISVVANVAPAFVVFGVSLILVGHGCDESCSGHGLFGTSQSAAWPAQFFLLAAPALGFSIVFAIKIAKGRYRSSAMPLCASTLLSAVWVAFAATGGDPGSYVRPHESRTALIVVPLALLGGISSVLIEARSRS